MKPVLALGVVLLATDPLTLGDLGRASDVARARVHACEREPAACASSASKAELARAMAVLHAESRVLFGVADPALAANVHTLAPALATSWVGPAPAGVAPADWVIRILAEPATRPAKKPIALAETVEPEAPKEPLWAEVPLVRLPAERTPPPNRILRIGDVEGPQAWLALAQEKRQQAIHMLDEMIGRRGPSPILLFRQAELYDEEARYQALLEVEAAEQKRQACAAEDWCDSATFEPNHTASSGWRQDAIRLYGDIERNSPRFERLDEVLYYMGLALLDEQRNDEALVKFVRLARGYPQSSRTPHAYLLIGEQHFDAGRVHQALLAYREAYRHPDARLRTFARYKAAWCLYNVGDAPGAYDEMERVVRKSSDGVGFDDFHQDLALFAAESDRVDRLEPMLRDIGRTDLVAATLDRAAKRLADNGDITGAVHTWHRVEAVGRLEEAKAARRHIVELALVSATPSGLAQELERLVGDVALDPSARFDGETDALAGLLRRAELRFHGECRKGLTPSCEYAEDAYIAHLGLQPDPSVAADLHYEVGELMYLRGDFVDAHRHYEAVLALAPRHPQAQFCAEAAIHAADAALARTDRPIADGTAPRPLSIDEQRLLRALDAYAEAWPSSEKAPLARYRAGYLFYEASHLTEARSRFAEVIARAPTSTEAETAAELVLDSLALEGLWRELHETARHYQTEPLLGGRSFKSDLELVAARSALKLADELAGKPGGAAAAARAYLDFVDAWPTSPLASRALNNAAIHFTDAGLDQLAAHARQRLVEVYPTSEYTPDHLAILGTEAERRGDFEAATGYYEALARGYPEHTGARDARYSAALFRGAMGEVPAAVVHYDAFVATWPTDVRSAGIPFDVVRLLQKAGLHDDALARARALIGHVDPARALFARILEIETLEAQGRLAEARAARAEADSWASTKEPTPELASLHGELRLAAVDEALARLEALEVSNVQVPAVHAADFERVVARHMRDKLAAAAELETRVVAVVETGDALSAQSAWTRLARGYEDVAQTIIGAPVPQYLTDDQRLVHVAELRDQAWTFERRAVEAYSHVVETAQRFGTFDESVRLAMESRHRLRPDQFEAPVNEELPEVSYVAGRGELGFETQL